MNREPVLATFRERILNAVARRQPLRIRGGGSKDFLGSMLSGELLSLTGYRGIIAYTPGEMVVTVRAGTPLAELRRELRQRGQYWRSDPPDFGGTATVGGAVASGIGGPGQPWCGTIRGDVLGVRILDGRGRILRFGGTVIKNVAGYDIARLMTGAMGTLGGWLDISLRVFPQPRVTCYGRMGRPPAAAVQRLLQWPRRPLPLAGAAYEHAAQVLRIRLAGSHEAVQAARDKLGLAPDAAGAQWWRTLRDHGLDFFTAPGLPLWQLQLPPGI